jgi:hypothetical protein
MNKNTNKELLTILSAHLSGKEDAINGRKPLVKSSLPLSRKAYRASYGNPLNKVYETSNKENPLNS